jgi:cytochrome c oxidase subunit II
MPPSKSALVVMLAGLALTPWSRLAAQPPVHEIQIVADKFQFEPATIQVVSGEPVRLIVRSKDVTHGFAIPALKIDERISRSGEPVVVTFTAPAPGEYEIACSEFCGRGHGHMKAVLVSVAGSIRTNR